MAKAGFGSSPKKIYKLMCNRLRTLRIGRYAPAESDAALSQQRDKSMCVLGNVLGIQSHLTNKYISI